MKSPTILMLLASLAVCVAHGATVMWDNISVGGGQIQFVGGNMSAGLPWNINVMYSSNPTGDGRYTITATSANLLFAGNWMVSTLGEIVDEMTTRHLEHYFYSQFMDEHPMGSGYEYTHDTITATPGSDFYLKFCAITDFPDYPSMESFDVIYGWVQLRMEADGSTSLLHSAYDLDGGPMIVGGGAWTGATPEPSTGMLLIVGLAALGLRRRGASCEHGSSCPGEMNMRVILAVFSVLAAGSAVASGGAPWMGDGRPLPEGAAWYGDRAAPEFRAVFRTPQGGRPATLRIATPCYFDLAVNGRRLTPCSAMTLWSPFDHTIYAEDFTLDPALLRADPASNVVTVALGNGFYNLPPFKFWGCHVFRSALSSGAPVFKAEVDGVPLSGWEWRETPVVRNCVYLGAVVDATREPGEWCPAVESGGPKGRIVKRVAPPVAQYGMLRGKARWLREGEVQVVDFGVNATGVPEFRFTGARRGDRVEIVYGERLNGDGTVNVLTQTAGQVKPKGRGFAPDNSPANRAAADEKFGAGCPCPAAQRDEYVCAGAEGAETFVPPFVWHVCRYAEVRGLKRLLGDGDAMLVLTSSQVVDTPLAAAFKPADSRIGRIHETCRRTFRSNLMGVQSDCPGRERLGYGGDIVATCDAYCLNWDMREFYLKTLQDFADEAADDGWLTETAPHVGIASRGMGGRSGPISWTLATPVLIDALLRHYGDERALAYYPVCARYSRLVAAKHPDGYIPTCIGDHEALERAPNDLTATAHWHEFLRLTASFAERLGRKGDSAEFKALAARAAAVFAERWVGEDGTVANGTQSAQSIALYLGLVPERLRKAAFAKLVEAVEAKGCAPSTGIFSTRYMLMFLSENGRVDLARRIVLHEGFPGWLHMLERGATTIWETWEESDDVYSNCHPMFGSVDEWILRFAE